MLSRIKFPREFWRKIYKRKFTNKSMNFIKKIFQGEPDSLAHLQFQKFSRGEFRNRALIKARKTKDKYTISTTPEFANELVRFCAEKLGDEKTQVKGAIVSTSDLKEEIEFKDIKQFQGVKRYIIDREMAGNEIIDLLEKFPKAFFALSFSSGDTSLKIKPKAPKSGKPKTKNKKPTPNFCKIVTLDRELGGSFVFEKPDFKKAEISHTYIIKEIEIPGELKKTGDFAKIREEAKRKGTIIREAEIDGEKTKREKEFVA